MEKAQPNLEKEKLEKLVYFLVNKLEDFIKYNMIVWNEKIEIAALQRPKYNEFNNCFYTYGLLRVGKKYLPLKIKAGRMITIEAKPFFWTITWEELEEEVNNQ